MFFGYAGFAIVIVFGIHSITSAKLSKSENPDRDWIPTRKSGVIYVLILVLMLLAEISAVIQELIMNFELDNPGMARFVDGHGRFR
jgi:hypothetical protein